jgi:hypothetical protein
MMMMMMMMMMMQVMLLLRGELQEGALREGVGLGAVAQEFCWRQYILGRAACQEIMRPRVN